jgi:hypothetical protein
MAAEQGSVARLLAIMTGLACSASVRKRSKPAFLVRGTSQHDLKTIEAQYSPIHTRVATFRHLATCRRAYWMSTSRIVARCFGLVATRFESVSQLCLATA